MPSSYLSQYHQKRNFSKTPEPSEGGDKEKFNNIFVIQEHHASHLHYDLRLEIGGTLKSWAVPKGPSTDPSEKRLAIPTEDHPLDYAEFEGEIPEGEYGAGRVYIWDKGTYTNLKKDISMEEQYQQGKIEIDLRGKRLQGGFALTKMKGKDLWLFLKMREE